MKGKKLFFILFIVCMFCALFSVSAFAYDNITEFDGDGLFFYEGALLPPIPTVTSERPVATIFAHTDMVYTLALHSGYTHEGADIWSIGSNAQFYTCSFGGNSWTATTSSTYRYDILDINYSNTSAASGSSFIPQGSVMPAAGSHITTYVGLLDEENLFRPDGLISFCRVNSSYFDYPSYLIIDAFDNIGIVPVSVFPKVYNDVVIPLAYNSFGDVNVSGWSNCVALVVDDSISSSLSIPAGVYVRSDLLTVVGIVVVDAQSVVSPVTYSTVSLDTPIEFSTNPLVGYPDMIWEVSGANSTISNDMAYVTNITFDSSVGDGVPVVVSAIHFSDDLIPSIGYSIVFTSESEAPPSEGGDTPDEPQPPLWAAEI